MGAVLLLCAKCCLQGASEISHQGRVTADRTEQQRLVPVCPASQVLRPQERAGSGWGGLQSVHTQEEMAQGRDGETSPPYT